MDFPVSFAGADNSARDHLARIAKKPVTFSTICRASSSVMLRPVRGCHTLRVRWIKLSLAAWDRFTKTSRPASRRSVLLVFGLGLPPMALDLRNLHLERPHRRDRRLSPR
jgi:hypothetical protein